MVWELDKEWDDVRFTTKELEQEPGDMVRDPQLVYEVAEEMAAPYQAMQRRRARAEAAAEAEAEAIAAEAAAKIKEHYLRYGTMPSQLYPGLYGSL